jgi:PDDEXK-like domain of unknown function (DUF3799)
MNRTDYEKIDAVNYSTLKAMDRSPSHYRYAMEHGQAKDTDAMILGRVTHMAVFEPHLIETKVAQWDGTRRGSEWEEFKLANADLEIIKPGPYQTAMAIAKSARAAGGRMIAEGRSEVTLTWADEVTGIEMKGRLDHISKGFGIIDLKTTADARPLIFGSRAASLSYHVQAALYSDGAERTSWGRLPYTILAVETSAPYAATLYTVTEDHLDLGRETYRGWLKKLKECRERGEYPSYPPSVLTLPMWSTYDASDEDMSDMGINFGGKDNG